MAIDAASFWLDPKAHGWYEESGEEDEYCVSGPYNSRAWYDPFISASPKPELWTLAPARTALLDNYLQDLSVHFAKKDKQLEQTNAELELKFKTLAGQWRTETAHISSIPKQVMNFNYQKIIGMGPTVLPILFRELERMPSYWFWALEAITGENPTRPEDIGNVTRMAESWLEWARTRGYLNVSSARILLRQSTEQQI